MRRLAPITMALAAALMLPSLGAASLRGSPASMRQQNAVAKEEGFSFLRTPAQVQAFVEKGYLVPLADGADYRLANVSFPYARPAVRTFVERLGGQYRDACGEPLVVTSLTRPSALQPANSHALSVHPTGMAVDLRVSERAQCRSWLEGTLLSLEGKGVLDVTRERRPPHYHVAIFPEEYAAHVARLEAAEAAAAEEEPVVAEAVRAAPAVAAYLPSAAPAPATAEKRPRQDEALVLAVLATLAALAVRELAARRRASGE